MALYASLAYAKSVQLASTTADDDKLLQLLRAASRRIDREMHPYPPYVRALFEPYIETRRILVTTDRINPALRSFSLPWSLLALTGVTVGTQALVVGTGVAGYPDVDFPPWRDLRLLDCCMNWWDYCVGCGDALSVIVSGIWGIHRNYAQAWMAVDAVTTTAITTTTQTTFTVANAAGDDLYGIANRISVGHLLKIDDEFMEVTGVSGNTVTVIRGANGSTAATHSLAAVVYRWEVEEQVKHAVARQAGLMYARLGAYTTVQIDGAGGEVRFPADLLWELRAALADFAYSV